MAKIAKKTKRYPSDMTDEEWERVAPLRDLPNGLSEILIPSRSKGEFLNEPVRDWLARREGDASLGRLEPGRGNVVGMRLDGGRR